jgi:ribonuclease P protein component
MTEQRATRFERGKRLVTAAGFRGVLRRGVRIEGPLFLLIGLRNGRDHLRLGITAGRRLGKAVARNRAKRLLRESFRRTPPEGLEGYDLVLVPRSEILERTQSEVDREYRDRLRRLRRRTAAGRGGARAPAADRGV